MIICLSLNAGIEQTARRRREGQADEHVVKGYARRLDWDEYH